MIETIVLNLAYVLYVGSGWVKTVLKLRLTLIGVSLGFIAWGVLEGSWVVIAWNVAFGGVHGYQVYKLWSSERAIRLSDEEQDIWQRLFPALTLLDFYTMWSYGSGVDYKPDSVLIEAGTEQKTIMLVLFGVAQVEKDGEVIATAGVDSLLGEISYILEQPASATVRSSTDVRVRSWDQEKITALSRLNPPAYDAMMAFIGQDLARKV